MGGSEGIPWSYYWVLVVVPQMDPEGIWQTIGMSVKRAAENSNSAFLRAEIVRPQPGIQIYYPRNRGLTRERRLWHWIEYAVSAPEAREAYDQDQYRFSACVIRRFYEAGAVGRCIGFEIERVLENHGKLPDWDVIHSTGATRFLRIARVSWRQMPVFNAFARDVDIRPPSWSTNERNIRLTPSRMRPTRWRQRPTACDRYRETRGRTVAALKVRCRQRRLAEGRMIRLRAKREDFLGRSAAGR